MSGGPGRTALVGGTGAVFLLCGLAGIVVLRAVAAGGLIPWVEPAVFEVASAFAIAGMIATDRLMSGRSRAPSAQPAAKEAAPAPLTRLQIDTRRGTRIVPAENIDWIEANGNYARLHLPDGDEDFLYRIPLIRLEHELDSIERVEPLPSGNADIRLTTGARVRLARRFAKMFHERTGRPA